MHLSILRGNISLALFNYIILLTVDVTLLSLGSTPGTYLAGLFPSSLSVLFSV